MKSYILISSLQEPSENARGLDTQCQNLTCVTFVKVTKHSMLSHRQDTILIKKENKYEIKF